MADIKQAIAAMRGGRGGTATGGVRAFPPGGAPIGGMLAPGSHGDEGQMQADLAHLRVPLHIPPGWGVSGGPLRVPYMGGPGPGPGGPGMEPPQLPNGIPHGIYGRPDIQRLPAGPQELPGAPITRDGQQGFIGRGGHFQALGQHALANMQHQAPVAPPEVLAAHLLPTIEAAREAQAGGMPSLPGGPIKDYQSELAQVGRLSDLPGGPVKDYPIGHSGPIKDPRVRAQEIRGRMHGLVRRGAGGGGPIAAMPLIPPAMGGYSGGK